MLILPTHTNVVSAMESDTLVDIDTLMQRVFAFSTNNELRENDFFVDVYHSMQLETERRNFFLKLVPGLSGVEDGSHKYFAESHLRFQVHPNGEVDAKEYAFYSTAPWMRSSRSRVLARYSMSIYNTKLFADKILSPLHRRNKRYYRYRILRELTDSTEIKMVEISVKPRFSNTQMVCGTFTVDVASGAVRTFDISFYYALTHMQIKGLMGHDGNARFVPKELTIDAAFKLVGNKVKAHYQAVSAFHDGISEDTLSRTKKSRFDLTSKYLLRIDTANIITNRQYFDTLSQKTFAVGSMGHRKNSEWADSASISSCASAETPSNVSTTSPKKKWYKRIFNSTTEKLLFSSRKYYIAEEQGEVKLPPLLTPEMFAYSRNKGFILQTKLKFDLNLPRDVQLRIRPKASFSFRQRTLYWRAPFSLDFLPQIDGGINIEVGNGNRTYSSAQAEKVRENLKGGTTNYDSLTHILRSYDFNFYKDFYSQFDFSFIPLVGLKINIGARYHNHTLVEWNDLTAGEGMQHHIRSFAPRLHIDWTPGLYYLRSGRHRIPLSSKFPTFRLDYERGIKTNFSDAEYERFEFDMQYTRHLYALRAIYLRAGFGLYTNRSENYFLDYDYFRDENLLESWTDGMSGKFYSLDSRWYNESKYYVRLSSTYESPMLLFSRIGFLSKTIQKERLYANMVFVTALHPYTEFGYGITSHFADLSLFAGMADHRSLSFGMRIVFHWFDGW